MHLEGNVFSVLLVMAEETRSDPTLMGVSVLDASNSQAMASVHIQRIHPRTWFPFADDRCALDVEFPVIVASIPKALSSSSL
jgi:hypothetical protein